MSEGLPSLDLKRKGDFKKLLSYLKIVLSLEFFVKR